MEKNEKLNKILIVIAHQKEGTLTLDELKEFVNVVLNHNPYGAQNDYKIEYKNLNRGASNITNVASYNEGVISIDEGFLENIVSAKTKIGDLLIALFHEQTHGEQEEIASEMKTNPEKHVKLNTSRKQAAEALDTRAQNIVFEQDIDDYYTMFKPYFPENFSDDYKTKRDMILHAIYIDKLYEIDARHQSCLKTYNFLKGLHADFKGNKNICSWIENEASAIDKTIKQEKENIKIVNFMKDLVSFKISNEYLQQLEDVYYKTQNAEAVLAKMKQTSVPVKQKNSEKQDKLHAFYLDLTSCLDMFAQNQSLFDLTDYYVFLQSNKRQLAVKDIDMQKGQATLDFDDDFSYIFERAIEEKLKIATPEEKDAISAKILEAATKENGYLGDKFGDTSKIFKFLNDKDKKEFVVKQLVNPANFDVQTPKNFTELFDAENESDQGFVNSLIGLYRRNYAKKPINDSPLERCKQRNINTFLYFNHRKFDNLCKKFGKSDEFNEILKREYKREKFDAEITKQAEIAIFGKQGFIPDGECKKINLEETQYMEFV